jgi:hypothetical protein
VDVTLVAPAAVDGDDAQWLEVGPVLGDHVDRFVAAPVADIAE